MPNLGENIARRLDQLGWNQAELARRTGLRTGHVSQIVNGQYASPSIDTVAIIARALATNLDELYPIYPLHSLKRDVVTPVSESSNAEIQH